MRGDEEGLMAGFPKPAPLAVYRAQRRSQREAALGAAYASVDERDKGICRATGRTTRAGDVDARVRREHHHLAGRRVRPDWRHDPARIVTLCAEAHQLVEAYALLVEGDNADGRLVFHWNEDVVPRGKEPFKLQSKRRSQNR
jgi:hypothetical protein